MNEPALQLMLENAERFLVIGMANARDTANFGIRASRSAMDLLDAFNNDFADWHRTSKIETEVGQRLQRAALAAAPEPAYSTMERYGQRFFVECETHTGDRGPHIACRLYPLRQFADQLDGVERFLRDVFDVLWQSPTVRASHAVGDRFSLAHRSRAWCVNCLEKAPPTQMFSLRQPDNALFRIVEETAHRVERKLVEDGLLRSWNNACWMATHRPLDRYEYAEPLKADPISGLATLRLLHVLGLEDAELWRVIDSAGGRAETFVFAPIGGSAAQSPMVDSDVLSACMLLLQPELSDRGTHDHH